MRIFVFAFLLILAGCMAHRVDLVANKRVFIATQKPDGYSMNASVYEQEGMLRLIGQVRKSPLALSNALGHIDVEILNPEGKMIARTIAVLRQLPAARHVSKPASFAKTIEVIPPVGSVVTLRYNPISHSDAEEL